MFIDTGSSGGRADFGIGPLARQALFVAGRKSASDFLDGAGAAGFHWSVRTWAPERPQ